MGQNHALSRLTLALFLILGLFLPASAQTTGEKVGLFLTSPGVAGALLTAGILFWFISVLTFGTGVAEVCCFVSFGLLFGGRYLTGDELWVPLALFAAGAIFAAIEVFVIPGLGVFGVLSLLSFAGLSVLVMENAKMGLVVFCVSMFLTVAGAFALMKYMPKFFATRKFLVLEPPVAKKETTPAAQAMPLAHVGDIGEVATTLRPVGAALFGTDRVEVVSEGEFLQKGAKVEVVRVEGSKVVVRSCEC